MDINRNRIFDELEQVMIAAAGAFAIPVTVRTIAVPDAASMARLEAAAGNFEPVHYWPTQKTFGAYLSPSQILQLAAQSSVAQIELNHPIELDSTQNVLADAGVPKAQSDFSLSGDMDNSPRSYNADDVSVCVLDSGIDRNHVDFAGQILAWADLYGADGGNSYSPDVPVDYIGHGTAVAGILAGQGNGYSHAAGVAPGAGLLIGRITGDETHPGTDWDIFQGALWCMAQFDDGFNVRVLSMSAGNQAPTDGTDSISRMFEHVAAHDIIPIVSAGNGGPALRTMGAPAASPYVITVCAMTPPSVADGRWLLDTYSSRGPIPNASYYKPDICAPGEGYVTPVPDQGSYPPPVCVRDDGSFRNWTESSVSTNSNYCDFAGTSAATPFVAGIVALMQQAAYTQHGAWLHLGDVRSALYSTAETWQNRMNMETGAGRIQSYQAIKAVSGLAGTPSASQYHSSTGFRNVALNGIDIWEVPVTGASSLGLTILQRSSTGTDQSRITIEGLDSGRHTLGSIDAQINARQFNANTPPLLGVATYRILLENIRGSGDYVIDFSYDGTAGAAFGGTR